jgi:hypothetical protein
MTHEHGREYRVKTALEDETEVLSGWTNCQEKVVQVITGFYGSPAKDRWLQVRNILCPDCLNRGLMIVEYPLILIEAEDSCFPPQADRRRVGSASSRTSLAGV